MSSTAPKLSQLLNVSIEVIRGPAQGVKQAFEKGKWTVGRGPENDLVLAQDLKISRNHIEVTTTNNQVFVKNVSQKNIMMVDGLLSVESLLKPDGVVQIGDSFIRFHFERPQEARAPLKVVPNAQGQSNSMVTAGGVQTPTVNGIHNQMPTLNRAPNQVPGFQRRQAPPVADIPLFSHPKFKFYAMIGVVGLAGLWLFTSETMKRKEVTIRDSVAITEEIGKSSTEVQQIREEQKKKGVDTPQYRLAESQFIKGFRDYQQGQYARAMEAFQSARSFYPEHELATRYYGLAKRRYDERIQMYMIQGRRYLGTQNYRMCESAFSTAVRLIKDDRSPLYQEALQFHEECQLKSVRK